MAGAESSLVGWQVLFLKKMRGPENSPVFTQRALATRWPLRLSGEVVAPTHTEVEITPKQLEKLQTETNGVLGQADEVTWLGGELYAIQSGDKLVQKIIPDEEIGAFAAAVKVITGDRSLIFDQRGDSFSFRVPGLVEKVAQLARGFVLGKIFRVG